MSDSASVLLRKLIAKDAKDKPVEVQRSIFEQLVKYGAQAGLSVAVLGDLMEKGMSVNEVVAHVFGRLAENHSRNPHRRCRV